jgi:ABC-2 type transport system ATP-binding protein
MMRIVVENLGKRFNREWIFRDLSVVFESGHSYTFLGANGSGKSTLLQVMSGIMPKTEGKISYTIDNKNIDEDHWYKHLAIAAPYLELIEEFTPPELLAFHHQFKPLSHSFDDILEMVELDNARQKTIKNFSSGMKQRLKLALAFYSDAPILMLDEPTSNLDARWSDWYRSEVQKHSKITIICSNLPNEYDFCTQTIVNLNDYKQM